MNGVMGLIGPLSEHERTHLDRLGGIDLRIDGDDLRVVATDEPQGRLEEASGPDWRCVFYGHVFDIEDERETTPQDPPAIRLGHLIKTRGLEGLAKTDGRYIVLFIDKTTGKTLLSADPLGMMSIFVNRSGETLMFSNDVNALLDLPSISKEPDPAAIAEFLSCSRYNLPVSRSFYASLEKLPSNHALTYHKGQRRIERFWTPSLNRDEVLRDDDATIVETARQLMLDATRIRMPQDGPMAAALSGGFDSSSIVSMMRHLDGDRQRPFTTVSFNFGSDEADEDDLIDAVSSANDTEHHRVNVLDTPFLTEADEAILSNGGPLMESGVLLLWKKKARLAQLGHHTSLSGLGGDEIFMGRMNFLADELCQLKLGSVYKEIRAIFPYDRSTGKRTSLRKVFNAYIAGPLEPHWLKNLRHSVLGSRYPPNWIRRSMIEDGWLASSLPRPTPPFADTIYQQDVWEVFNLELIQAAVPYHSVAGNGTKVDTRFPLIDRKLVEYMFRVPRRLKISEGHVRYVQRETMRPFLPPAVLQDHLKKDFHPVLDVRLREEYADAIGPLMQAKSRLSDDFVDWGQLKTTFDAFMAGKSKPHALWVAYALERWLQLRT